MISVVSIENLGLVLKVLSVLLGKEKEGKKITSIHVYYISSLKITAAEFGQKIREHWLIENELHWTKDVVFKEDKSKIKTGMAPENFSIIRSIVLNMFRKNGFLSPTKTLRMFANNINYLLLCLS